MPLRAVSYALLLQMLPELVISAVLMVVLLPVLRKALSPVIYEQH